MGSIRDAPEIYVFDPEGGWEEGTYNDGEEIVLTDPVLSVADRVTLVEGEMQVHASRLDALEGVTYATDIASLANQIGVNDADDAAAHTYIDYVGTVSAVAASLDATTPGYVIPMLKYRSYGNAVTVMGKITGIKVVTPGAVQHTFKLSLPVVQTSAAADQVIVGNGMYVRADAGVRSNLMTFDSDPAAFANTTFVFTTDSGSIAGSPLEFSFMFTYIK